MPNLYRVFFGDPVYKTQESLGEVNKMQLKKSKNPQHVFQKFKKISYKNRLTWIETSRK